MPATSRVPSQLTQKVNTFLTIDLAGVDAALDTKPAILWVAYRSRPRSKMMPAVDFPHKPGLVSALKAAVQKFKPLRQGIYIPILVVLKARTNPVTLKGEPVIVKK